MYNLVTVSPALDSGTWNSIFQQTLSQVWPMVGSFLIPLLEIIIGILLLFNIFKAFAEYRQGGEVQIKPIIFLIAGLAVLMTFGANDAALLKQLVGLNK